jgi:hypothetical protein
MFELNIFLGENIPNTTERSGDGLVDEENQIEYMTEGHEEVNLKKVERTAEDEIWGNLWFPYLKLVWKV